MIPKSQSEHTIGSFHYDHSVSNQGLVIMSYHISTCYDLWFLFHFAQPRIHIMIHQKSCGCMPHHMGTEIAACRNDSNPRQVYARCGSKAVLNLITSLSQNNKHRSANVRHSYFHNIISHYVSRAMDCSCQCWTRDGWKLSRKYFLCSLGSANVEHGQTIFII